MSTLNSHSDWWTPYELKNILSNEFSFCLDAAADEKNKICDDYISEELDALKTPWIGSTIWCNPPYGKGHSHTIKEFVKRGYEQHIEQKNTVVMLLPAYTDPKYWKDYCVKAHEIRFLVGRLQFLEAGKKKMSARFPSAIVIWKYIQGQHYGKAPNIWHWDWKV